MTANKTGSLGQFEQLSGKQPPKAGLNPTPPAPDAYRPAPFKHTYQAIAALRAVGCVPVRTSGSSHFKYVHPKLARGHVMVMTNSIEKGVAKAINDVNDALKELWDQGIRPPWAKRDTKAAG